MKGFFQLVNPDTGVRSSAISRSRKEFAEFLSQHRKDIVGAPIRGIPINSPHTIEEVDLLLEDCFVLVLVELPDPGSMVNTVDWMFSEAPMMRVSTFIEHYLEK